MRPARALVALGVVGLAVGVGAWETHRLIPELEIPRLLLLPLSFLAGLVGLWSPRALRKQAAAPRWKSRTFGLLAWTLLFAALSPWLFVKWAWRDADGARFAIASSYGGTEFYLYEAGGFDNLKPIVYERDWVWRREIPGPWPGYYAIELFSGATYTLGSHQVKLARENGRPRAWIDGSEAHVCRLEPVSW